MKALPFFTLVAMVTSCSSSVAPNPAVSAMHKQHEQILFIEKALTTQSLELDQASLAKLMEIISESTATIQVLDKLDASKWQESAQLGLVNQLAMKESILSLAAQQIPKHAVFY
jgi:hypothetical protein